MRILAAGSEVEPPRSPLRVVRCPPGGPALLGAARRGGRRTQTALDSGQPALSRFAPQRPVSVPSKNPNRLNHQVRDAGFTLLELLVVVAIIAVATAGVSLSLRDTSQTALEREAQRLAVLFESARAQSRASGTAVFWRPTIDGFRFEGLPPGALPTRWLEAGTRAGANVAIQLGPEPIIGAQAVDILSGGQEQSQPARVLRIGTDGLRPFALQTAEQQP
jgi:general secretion pathway protein H